MSRTDALERYNALPVPDTTQEHWRFTDLRGFDPDAFGHDRGQAPDVAVPSMLELDLPPQPTVTTRMVASSLGVGGPAAVPRGRWRGGGPWLCGPAFRRVCPCRSRSFTQQRGTQSVGGTTHGR